MGSRRTVITNQSNVTALDYITPGEIRELFAQGNHSALAFLPQFLLAYPSSIVDSPISAGYVLDEKVLCKVFKNLYRLEPLIDDNGNRIPRTVRLSDEASELCQGYFCEIKKKRRGSSSYLSSVYSYLPRYLLSLSLVIHYMNWSIHGNEKDELLIHEDTMITALAFMEIFEAEQRRVYSTFFNKSEK
jgi:hypothetical protein